MAGRPAPKARNRTGGVAVAVAEVSRSAQRAPGDALMGADRVDGTIGGWPSRMAGDRDRERHAVNHERSETPRRSFRARARWAVQCSAARRMCASSVWPGETARRSRARMLEAGPSTRRSASAPARRKEPSPLSSARALPFGVTGSPAATTDEFSLWPAPDGSKHVRVGLSRRQRQGRRRAAYVLVMTTPHDLEYDIVPARSEAEQLPGPALMARNTRGRRFRQRLLAQGVPDGTIARSLPDRHSRWHRQQAPGARRYRAAQLQAGAGGARREHGRRSGERATDPQRGEGGGCLCLSQVGAITMRARTRLSRLATCVSAGSDSDARRRHGRPASGNGRAHRHHLRRIYSRTAPSSIEESKLSFGTW